MFSLLIYTFIYLQLSIYKGKKISALQLPQKMKVFVEHFIFHGVFMIASFFFLFDQPRFQQNLHMVRNRRLRKVQHILNIRTLTTASLIGDVMQDLQAIGIAQGLGYFFDLLNIHAQENTLINANVSIFIFTAKYISCAQIFPSYKKIVLRSA